MAQGVQDHITFASGNKKTVCTSRVLAALGIDRREYHYSGTERHMMQVLRRWWSARSVKSKLATVPTVGGSRRILSGIAASDRSIVCFVVIVPGHALMLGAGGETLVDTAPRKRDKRRITSIYAVRQKGN